MPTLTSSPATPPPMSTSQPNAGSLLMEGIRLRLQRERIQEKAKAGTLRGGSAGATIAGVDHGTCVRAAAARLLGLEPLRDEVEWLHKQLMFDAGNQNEDLWAPPLAEAWALSGGRVLREEEFPIEWTIGVTSGGGREDFVLLDAAGKAVSMTEQKLVCSLATATTVLGKRVPKIDNVIQAANYMHRANVPGQLWYTSRVNWAVPDWSFTQAAFPCDREHPAYPYLEWQFRKGQKPKVKKITPFVVGFELSWQGGRLWWRPFAAREGWRETTITVESIDAYYGRVVALANGTSGETLPAKPSTASLDGEKGHYNPCDYCDWKPICSRASTRSEWLELMKDVQPTVGDDC